MKLENMFLPPPPHSTTRLQQSKLSWQNWTFFMAYAPNRRLLAGIEPALMSGGTKPFSAAREPIG
jgi:hypothetical protein